jgi:hypothetical protein
LHRFNFCFRVKQNAHHSKEMMATAYQPWFTPISFDGIDRDTPVVLLPALLNQHDELGGYDPRTGQHTPFKNVDRHMAGGLTKEMLDSLTAAVGRPAWALPTGLFLTSLRRQTMRWKFTQKTLGSMTGIFMRSSIRRGLP